MIVWPSRPESPRGSAPDADELLQRFYAADDAPSEGIAVALLACAQPLIRAHLRREDVRVDDWEDLCQDSGIRLLLALRGSRAPGGRRVEHWDGFVATLTRNVFWDFCRRRSVRPRTDSLEGFLPCGDGSPDGALPASAEDVAAAVTSALFAEEMREMLWPEICALPPRQRAALLLHLEPDDLLRLQGRKSRIAEALDISLPEFREVVWPALPLSDRQIAERLEVAAGESTSAEKRVSNLRVCALKRLERFWLRRDPRRHLP